MAHELIAWKSSLCSLLLLSQADDQQQQLKRKKEKKRKSHNQLEPEEMDRVITQALDSSDHKSLSISR